MIEDVVFLYKIYLKTDQYLFPLVQYSCLLVIVTSPKTIELTGWYDSKHGYTSYGSGNCKQLNNWPDWTGLMLPKKRTNSNATTPGIGFPWQLQIFMVLKKQPKYPGFPRVFPAFSICQKIACFFRLTSHVDRESNSNNNVFLGLLIVICLCNFFIIEATLSDYPLILMYTLLY